jgi:glycine/D-amino acid oxidase-like deaminating enzyme
MYMLERAREAGVRLIEGRVDGVETAGGRVIGARVSGGGGRRTIGTPRFVNAAGPHVKTVGRLLDVEIPVFCERHAKVAFHDTQAVVPRHAPMMIWTDPVRLPWSDDEREELGQAESLRHLLEEMPAGVHGRPEGGGDSPIMLGVWTYDVEPMEPRFPVEFDPAYAEIVIRGMTRLIPGLRAYVPRLPKHFVDGGYYTKTEENRLLSGPLPVEGAYVLGGLSGYGMMSSNGAADLLADYIAERPLPRYAPAFRLDRYESPAYRALLADWGDSGQL